MNSCWRWRDFGDDNDDEVMTTITSISVTAMCYRKRAYLYRRDVRRAGWSWSRGSWCHCCWQSCRPFATGCTPDSRLRTESLPEASSLHTRVIVAAITPQCDCPPTRRLDGKCVSVLMAAAHPAGVAVPSRSGVDLVTTQQLAIVSHIA